jgi:hypothetical protein
MDAIGTASPSFFNGQISQLAEARARGPALLGNLEAHAPAMPCASGQGLARMLVPRSARNGRYRHGSFTKAAQDQRRAVSKSSRGTSQHCPAIGGVKAVYDNVVHIKTRRSEKGEINV